MEDTHVKYEVTIFCLILHAARVFSASCGVTEEGASFSIPYQFTSGTVHFAKWFQDTGTTNTELGSCNNTNVGGLARFVCKSDRKHEMQENQNTFTLTILSVTREGLLPYKFVARGNGFSDVSYSCDLTVYTKPHAPKCEQPSFTPDNTALSVTCSTDQVFPQAQCVFHRQGSPGDLLNPTYLHEAVTSTSSGLIFYKTTCKVIYPLDSRGSYAFFVDMFVTINNVQYGPWQSTVTNPIDLTGCGVAQEGTTFNITYHVSHGRATTAQWSQNRGMLFPAILGDCTYTDFVDGFVCTSDQEHKMYQINNEFTLNIMNVTRVELLPYLFIARGDNVPTVEYSCNLTVYAKPESPRCDPPALTSDNKSLSVSCSTDKVYPGARCVFTREGFQRELSDITYSHQNYTTSDGLTYYRSTCTLTYPVNNPGYYAFFVDMFIDINNIRYGQAQSTVPEFYNPYDPYNISINIEGSTSTTIKLCPNTNNDVTIQCQVPKNDVSPEPNFTVFFNGTSKPGNSTESDMLYMYTVRDTLNTSGTLNVSCGAENSLFSDLNNQSGKQISVQEPPRSPPQLIINNNQPVVENVPFNVSCSVDGGFPLVSDVNITCRPDHDMISVTNDSNVVSKIVTVNRTMDGAQCDCVAQHVTGCYNNNTDRAGLVVTYQAAVKTLTANNEQNIQNLTLDLNDQISLTCVADGNPPPTITILNHRITEPQKSGEGHNLTYVKDNLACTDTAIYTCEATNFVTTDKMSQKQVHVFVRCPQQPQHADNTTFSAIVGESVTLDLDVIGYPAPTVYTLRQKQKEVAQVDTPDGNGRDGTYQFMYESADPPRGTVHLTIGNLSKGHFTDYLLTIENGVGQALEFRFVLETEVPGTDDNLPLIIGVVVGAVVLLVLIIVVIIFLTRRGFMKNLWNRKRSGRAHNDNEEEHVIENDLYGHGRGNSQEVVIDNSDLYAGNVNAKSNEVVIDNSDLYSGGFGNKNNEVVVDNSALYGKSSEFQATRDALYKNYSDVVPTITSATAAPVRNMRNGGDSPYEDVQPDGKSPGPKVQPKPQVAVKPMAAPKPTPAPKPGAPSTSGQQGAFAIQDEGGDQTYASVIKSGKSKPPKTNEPSQRESDLYPDQSKKPEVPEKKYEKEYEQTQPLKGKDKKKQTADEIPMVSQGGAAASSSYEDVEVAQRDGNNPYVNGGFAEDDGSVYANTGGNKSRKD